MKKGEKGKRVKGERGKIDGRLFFLFPFYPLTLLPPFLFPFFIFPLPL